MKKIVLIFILIATLISCKKEDPIPDNGIYRGVFREIHDNGDTLASGVVYIALFEENSTFTLVGDSTTNAPASHNGTYTIESGKRINYLYTGVHQPQFDSDHYLDTLYTYFFDDELFEFWFQNGSVKYEYRLARD